MVCFLGWFVSKDGLFLRMVCLFVCFLFVGMFVCWCVGVFLLLPSLTQVKSLVNHEGKSLLMIFQLCPFKFSFVMLLLLLLDILLKWKIRIKLLSIYSVLSKDDIFIQYEYRPLYGTDLFTLRFSSVEHSKGHRLNLNHCWNNKQKVCMIYLISFHCTFFLRIAKIWNDFILIFV